MPQLAGADEAPLASTITGQLPTYYEEEEVAAHLKVSVRTLQRWRKAKSVPHHWIGTRPVYTLADVQQIMGLTCQQTPASSIGSPTSTPSSAETAVRSSTSNGGRRGGPSGALRAIQNLS